ncbi:LIM zinc-binding domain-containing protein [Plasmodiophora brassicae]|nr:hypothetical protein PBRA_000022 [Plasmodiophora brassicae]
MATIGDDLCTVCGKKVYAVEKIVAESRLFHKNCFKCHGCSKRLDPGKITSHEGNVYCPPCYTKSFGPKGYGFANGQAGLSTHVYSTDSKPN